MGNVTLPTPVAMAGGAICILGGYLLGVVTGPDTPSRTTAVVESYDPATSRLCLTGETVEDQEGATDDDGVLCGTWRRAGGASRNPEPGDEFRFVSVVSNETRDGAAEGAGRVTIIYGDVVR